MPIYAFRCDKCGNEYEELVPRMDATAPCPRCSSRKVSRAITAPADYRGSAAGQPMCPSCPDMPVSACPNGMCRM